MTEDERLERIDRAFGFVPHNLYDEITKLAEYALGDFIKERDEARQQAAALADTLREIADGGAVNFKEAIALACAALDQQETP